MTSSTYLSFGVHAVYHVDVIDYYCIVIAGILSFPTFLPENIRENFVVVGITTLLIPLVLYRNPDMQHQGKNAEKSGTLYGFGNGVSLSEGDFKPDLVKSALMRVARLLGKDHEIADLLREFTKSDEKLANIPGEVNHRLLILTTLAILVIAL